MPIKTNLVILILVLSLGIHSRSYSKNTDVIDETYKILFIGSSYFNNNNLPLLFENLVIASGKTVEVHCCITNGLYLGEHASSSSTEQIIKEENWDYVILQGVGSLLAYPKTFTQYPVYSALTTLRQKILSNYSETKIVFCLPWAYEDGMTWVQGWTDTYDDMQNLINDRTLKYCNELELLIAPVGVTWQRVLQEKNYPLHYLHARDWNHPSPKGSYLMACVIFSTVYLESSTDMNYYYNLSVDEADYFQSVASITVLDNPDMWNITTTDIEIENTFKPNEYLLYQNFPNPFNPETRIIFFCPLSAM